MSWESARPGRLATFAAALMIQRGLVANVEQAEAALKAKRPRIALGQAQRALVAG